MLNNHAQLVREAIENLINAKLIDLARPGGVDRFTAHRGSGVASWDVRNAEKQLESAIAHLISPSRGQQTNGNEFRQSSISAGTSSPREKVRAPARL